MDRTGVVSSTVVSIGYDAESSTLEIEFHNGTVYQYFDISETTHVELITAGSVGAYLNSHIKGKYRFSKV